MPILRLIQQTMGADEYSVRVEWVKDEKHALQSATARIRFVWTVEEMRIFAGIWRIICSILLIPRPR